MSTTYCRHIKTNGDRCGSPALRANTLCYFHLRLADRHRALAIPPSPSIPTIVHPTHSRDGFQPEPQLIGPSSRSLPLQLPALEDHESIQVAVSMLVGALAADRIDVKRASTILYGLQVASANCRHIYYNPPSMVTDTVHTSSGEEIAPDEDPSLIADFKKFCAELPDDDHDEDDEDCDCEACQ